MSKLIYVAASFAYEDKTKTEERKAKIEEVVNKLKTLFKKKALKFDFYLPHQLKIENAWDISLEEWSREVYTKDVAAIEKASMILFLSFGKENNAGAVWEVGYVVGMHRMTCTDAPLSKIICIKLNEEPESLMLSESVDVIMREDEIDSYDWNNLPRYRTKLEKIS